MFFLHKVFTNTEVVPYLASMLISKFYVDTHCTARSAIVFLFIFFLKLCNEVHVGIRRGQVLLHPSFISEVNACVSTFLSCKKPGKDQSAGR